MAENAIKNHLPSHFVLDASPCIKIWGHLPDPPDFYTWRRVKDKMAETEPELELEPEPNSDQIWILYRGGLGLLRPAKLQS